jgi:hypothetical protein
MRTKYTFSGFALFVVALLCPIPASAQTPPMDASVALQYFREAQAACDRDGGKLWGRSVCGPILFVDPQTRRAVANQSDLQGLLVKQDEVFAGRLADKQPVANAAITWGGVKWAMIMWPSLTRDKFQRVKLMVHESYHRIQNELGFPVIGAKNDHLDSKEGRIWLQLEWRALGRALTSEGAARRRAIVDALTFRNYRRSLFPNSDSSERTLEMHEGLAEYTGFMLSARDNKELIERLAKQIEQGTARPTFVGSFAYSSGPAYGALLDGSGAAWLKGLTPQNDLGELLLRSLKIKLSPDLKASAEKQVSRYDGDALRLAESGREAARQKRIAEYRMRLVDGPTLLIPLTDKRSVSFNSGNVVPLEGFGTVYPTARVSDEWGILEVSNGALMVQNEGGRIIKVYVSIPADLNARPLNGDGWSLQLDPGWVVAPAERKGDYTLKKLEKNQSSIQGEQGESERRHFGPHITLGMQRSRASESLKASFSVRRAARRCKALYALRHSSPASTSIQFGSAIYKAFAVRVSIGSRTSTGV